MAAAGKLDMPKAPAVERKVARHGPSLGRRQVIRIAAAAGLSIGSVGSMVKNATSLEASTGRNTKLPEPPEMGEVTLTQALRARRSVREFSPAALSLSEVSTLLWAGQGITARGGLRTSPSAGALYPLELFLAVGNVVGLSAGIYRYQPLPHALTAVAPGDRRRGLAEAALAQMWIAQAAAIIVIGAVPTRTTVKYGRRGLRYVDLEAGHAAQNICLQAGALGIAITPVGAFDDARVKTQVQMDEGGSPIYLLPVGKR